MALLGMELDDRVAVGLVAGLCGNLVKTALDEVSLRLHPSKRSFREAASGTWVSTQEEAVNLAGQVLGGLFDFGMASVGGVAITGLMTMTGKDYLPAKGVASGITIGSFITFLLSSQAENKVRPKDAVSNLSYMLSHAVYGVVTAYVASKLGSPSLYGSSPPMTTSSPPREPQRRSRPDTTQSPRDGFRDLSQIKRRGRDYSLSPPSGGWVRTDAFQSPSPSAPRRCADRLAPW